MKITKVAIVGIGLALGTAVAHGAPRQEKPQQQAQQQLSPKVAKALQAAQELLKKEDWEGAHAHVQEAQAVPDRRPYDDFQIAEMLGYIELKREKFAEA